MRKQLVCAGTALAAGLVLWATGCGGDSGTSDTLGSSSTPMETYTYTVIGSNIVFSWEQSIDTTKWCSGSTMLTQVDTNDAGSDTVPFTLSGNTLTIAQSTDSLASGAVVVYNRVYSRTGSGTSLIGTWLLTDLTYTVVSGNPTAGELDTLNADRADALAMLDAGYGERLEVTSSTVNIYATYTWSDMFVAEMPDTSGLDITIVKVSANMVRVTGNITGEVVTISYNEAAGTTTWTSSNAAAHPAYTYYADPVTCPNPYMPSWIPEVMLANQRTVAKVVAPMWNAPTNPRFIPFKP
jgi:hypothetical protein